MNNLVQFLHVCVQNTSNLGNREDRNEGRKTTFGFNNEKDLLIYFAKIEFVFYFRNQK